MEPDINRTMLERFGNGYRVELIRLFPSRIYTLYNIEYKYAGVKAMGSWVTKKVCGAGEVEGHVKGFSEPPAC